MKPTKDIQGREDVELLVDTFYKSVMRDDMIGYIFTEVVELDWEQHIPTMYDFWETTLFHKAIYKGNPIQVHQQLNDKEKLKQIHFERWLSLFNRTVDNLFVGEKAELAKTRALSIATVIQIKLTNS